TPCETRREPESGVHPRRHGALDERSGPHGLAPGRDNRCSTRRTIPAALSAYAARKPSSCQPDGRTFLLVGEDQRVWICDLATGSVRGRTPALGGYAYGVEFSPNGKTFFTGLDNGQARLWDAATVTPLGDPISIPDVICEVLFSRDGQSILIAC